MTAKHSNLGPSSAERWMTCPGSVAAIASLPVVPGSSIHAAEGSAAHGLCEAYVTGKLTLKALMAKVGTVIKHDGFDITVTDEMVDAVIEWKDLIDADTAALKDLFPGKTVEGRAEVRVYATSVSKQLYGTADYVLFVKGLALKVYDFKYGQGVAVDVERNKQMAIYALAAMDTMTGRMNYDGSVELVIHQPRAGGDSIRRWTVPNEWASQFVHELNKAVFLALSQSAPRVPSEKACRWCAFKPLCPEAHADVQKQAMTDFEDVPKKLPESGLPDISGLPLEVLVKAFEHEEYVTAWFESVRLHLKGRLEAGLPVPGYKLVEGRSNRKFIDDLKVIEAFEDLLGEALLEPRKLISPAKLEKIVGKGKIDHLTFKPEGGKSIAKDSDARPAAKNSAERDFEALPAPQTVDALLAELETPKKEPMWPL